MWPTPATTAFAACSEASPQPDPNPGLPSGLTTTLAIAQGQVSTFAGSGTATNTDGTGTSAAFKAPSGEAIIGNTLYVLDADAIRAVDLTTGDVSTIVGPASSGGSAYTDSLEPRQRHLRQPGEPHDRRHLPLLRRQRQHQAHRSCDGGHDDGVRGGFCQWLWWRGRCHRRSRRRPLCHDRRTTPSAAGPGAIPRRAASYS